MAALPAGSLQQPLEYTHQSISIDVVENASDQGEYQNGDQRHGQEKHNADREKKLLVGKELGQ